MTKHSLEKLEESDDGQEEEGDVTEDLDLSKAPREEESFDEFSGKVRKFWGEEQKRKEAEQRKKAEAEILAFKLKSHRLRLAVKPLRINPTPNSKVLA